MRHIVCVCVALSLVSAVVAQSQTTAPPRLRAGAASADIAPKQTELAIATDSIRDHLFARAVVVDAEVDAGCRSMTSDPQTAVPRNHTLPSNGRRP